MKSQDDLMSGNPNTQIWACKISNKHNEHRK
jgi:hypothetical protein